MKITDDQYRALKDATFSAWKAFDENLTEEQREKETRNLLRSIDGIGDE